MRALAVSLALLAAVALRPAPIFEPCRFHATVDSIHDGDTLTATIHFPYDVDIRSSSIRESTYDSWEVTRTRQIGVTEAEIEKGIKARDFLSQLIYDGELWIETPSKKPWRDAHGRLLGKYWVRSGGKWIDVALEMKNNGHIREAGK